MVVATGADLEPRVRREGFDTVVAGPTAMEGAGAAMADESVTSAPESEPWRFPGAMFGGVIASAKLPRLRQVADDVHPQLVVHPEVDLAAPLVAAALGLRSVAYGFAQPLDARLLGALAQRVEPLWRSAGLEPRADAGIYRDRYLDPCPPSLQGDRGAAAAVVEPVRPEIPGDPAASLPEWASRLGSRPVVYLSLGTVPLFNRPDKFEPLLAGLADENLDLVATVSDLYDPAALGPQPSNVHLERWLPLAPLLPLCDAVVCHAGSGTTLAALAAGLPLVLVPQGADQHVNAAACQRRGVARVLRGEAVTPTAVREAVLAIIHPDSPERSAARHLAGEIATMPAATDVVRALP